MYHEFFTGHGVLMLPILAMLLFAATFLGAVIWTVSRGRSLEYQALASLPLDLDSQGKAAGAEADHAEADYE